MGAVQRIAQHVVESGKDTYTAAGIARALGITVQQASNGLRNLTDYGAIEIRRKGHGRTPSLYVAGESEPLQARAEGRIRRGARPGAQRQEAAEDEAPWSFCVDSDGDLQLLRPNADPIVMPNEAARRLVAFVALQASAILMARTA